MSVVNRESSWSGSIFDSFLGNRYSGLSSFSFGSGKGHWKKVEWHVVHRRYRASRRGFDHSSLGSVLCFNFSWIIVAFGPIHPSFQIYFWKDFFSSVYTRLQTIDMTQNLHKAFNPGEKGSQEKQEKRKVVREYSQFIIDPKVRA